MSTIPDLITSKAIMAHLDNLTHEEYYGFFIVKKITTSIVR